MSYPFHGQQAAPCAPCAPQINPAAPTAATPGTREKVRVLEARAEAELPLFHPDDEADDSRVAFLGRILGGFAAGDEDFRRLTTLAETPDGPHAVEAHPQPPPRKRRPCEALPRSAEDLAKDRARKRKWRARRRLARRVEGRLREAAACSPATDH